MPVIGLRHILALPLFSILGLQTAAGASAAETWKDLSAKRAALKSFHEEFDFTRRLKGKGFDTSSESSMIVDSANGRWRERFISGAGDHAFIFDGANEFEIEDGLSEYVRVRQSSKRRSPQLRPYSEEALEISKAVERERLPCGFSTLKHKCVILDIPVKPWARQKQAGVARMLQGTRRAMFDVSTGLMISSQEMQTVIDPGGEYQSITTYTMKRLTYNGPVNEDLFRVPASATKEVKEFPRWDASAIKKRLAGKPAPELVLQDIQGRTVKLSDLKGKTVLLDFWATWCGPCRADGPALDKLWNKYGDKSLMVIGISIDEARPVVEKFLAKHPHKYPIALTTENDMPRPYRIGVFPTYLVINREGDLVTATEGDKGFSELRKLLKKAGLDTD